MSRKIKDVLGNLLVAALSLTVCFLAMEFVIFRYILKPDDVLANVSINNVVRYKPNTTAYFRHPDGRETLTMINAQGWNSLLPSYEIEKKPDVKRVAVVGDSYVHGAFVNVHDGFPEVLKSELKRSGHRAEVLRFGMDGAPLSQYLHVIRQEAIKYRPDLIVIPLIHNDFDETYRFLRTRYASSFLKVEIDDQGRTKEISPSNFKPGWADVLRSSATFRYLYYETNLYLKLKSIVSRYVWGGDEDYSPEHIQSAVDIRKIQDDRRNRLAAHYVLKELKSLSKQYGFKLVILMDGVREAIYEDRDRNSYEVAKLNDLARDVTSQLNIPFLDLQDTFAQDYAAHGEYLEFDYDWHWNKRGNRLVGKAAAEFVIRDLRLWGLITADSTGNQQAARPDEG